MTRPSLRLQIVFTLTIVLLAASFLIALVVMTVTKQSIMDQKFESASTLVNFLQYSLDSVCYGNDEVFLKGESNWQMQRLTKLFSLEKEVRSIFLVDRTGRVIASNKLDQVGTFVQDKDLHQVIVSPEILARLPKGLMLLNKISDELTVSAPLFLKNKVVGALRMTLSLKDLQSALRKSYRVVLTYIIFNALVVVIFGSFLLSRSIVRPIERLVKATESIAKGDFSEYVEARERDELGHLLLAFNRMAARIKETQHQLQEQIASLEHTNQQLHQSQGEVLASEKLALVGKLAAGIAHEIGNPLSAVLGYTSLLQKKETLDAESMDYLTRVEKELNRINTTIRELLDFSRIEKAELTPVNIDQVINNSLSLVAHQKKFHSISLVSSVSQDLSLFAGSEHQVQQVVLNLLLNAGDAVREGGTILILADRMTWQERALLADAEPLALDNEVPVPDFGLGAKEVQVGKAGFSPNEPMVRILVADNGEGINPEHLSRIFDPFFTTREPGKGTGLGLAICNRIVESHGGTMMVRSQVGKGSAFLVLLPAKGKSHA